MHSYARVFSIGTSKVINTLKHSKSGCSSIVLFDLKQSEAEKAAEELVHFACAYERVPSGYEVFFLMFQKLVNAWRAIL